MFIHRKKTRCQLHLFTLMSIIGLSSSAPFNASTENCGKSVLSPDSYDRIVGGSDASPGEFPWMVSLREYNELEYEHICGAAILNENWIITAAHCIGYTSPNRYEILTGLHKLSKERDATVKRYKISKLIVHAKFDDDTFENDIALLKTKKPIDISGSKGYINSICLPKNTDDPIGGAIVTGWGHTSEDGWNSDTLQKVIVPIIPRELCKESYGSDDDPTEVLDETMICAGITGRDSCQNDSGGPLFQTDENGVSTLIGLVSHGRGCGIRFYPGVYTKISMFQDWIDEAMTL